MSGDSVGGPRIELSSISKSYPRHGKRGGALHVYRGLDLNIGRGEFLAIVGPSGCGKSTLLKIVAGLTAVESGELAFLPKGISVRFGFVFQDYSNALAPWRSVIRNVEFGLEIEGVARKERRPKAINCVGRVGLAGYEEALPWQLSGGMQQRVQIARVLAYEANVLLMDEPFGSLDAQMRVLLQEDLRIVFRETAATVLFVTHSIEEALYLGERVIVLSNMPARVLYECEGAHGSYEGYESFAGSTEFRRRYEEIWEVLRGELRESLDR